MSTGLGEWALVAAVIAGSFLIGVVADVVGVGLLGSDAGPGARGRVALAKALRGQLEVWAVLIGVSIYKPFDFLEPNTQLWIDRVVIVVAVFSVTAFFARLAGKLIQAYLAKESVNAPSGTIFVNLARIVVWAIGFTFVLGALGVQIGPLVASLGIIGIAVSLGLQDTFANFFAGLQITLSRQIQPGQYIRLSTSQEGLVTDVTWRNTTLLVPSNDLLIIPNTVIATTLVTNFTAQDGRHIESVPFTVMLGSDLDEGKRVAVRVAREVRDAHTEAIDDFEPECTLRAFAPDGISAALTIRVARFEDRLPVVSDLIERLHRGLAEAGVRFGAGPSVAQQPPA